MAQADDARDEGRRRFLVKVGAAGLAGSGVVATLGTVAFSDLRAYNERSPVFKLGRPEDFASGTRVYLDGPRLFVGRDTRGLYAVSAVCSHLGCIVRDGGEGFACPCHGSRFDARGAVIGGPAPRPLSYVALTVEPNGLVYANVASRVDPDDRLEV